MGCTERYWKLFPLSILPNRHNFQNTDLCPFKGKATFEVVLRTHFRTTSTPKQVSYNIVLFGVVFHEQ